jgi:hypothetical protein
LVIPGVSGVAITCRKLVVDPSFAATFAAIRRIRGVGPDGPVDSLLAALHAVLRSTLLASIDAKAVEGSADDVIPDTGKVTDSTTTHEHDGMFLEVMSFAPDVCRDFLAVRESNTSHLAKRRVGLLGSDGSDLKTHTASLRTGVKVPDLRFGGLVAAGFADELVNSRHAGSLSVDRSRGSENEQRAAKDTETLPRGQG